MWHLSFSFTLCRVVYNHRVTLFGQTDLNSDLPKWHDLLCLRNRILVIFEIYACLFIFIIVVPHITWTDVTVLIFISISVEYVDNNFISDNVVLYIFFCEHIYLYTLNFNYFNTRVKDQLYW